MFKPGSGSTMTPTRSTAPSVPTQRLAASIMPRPSARRLTWSMTIRMLRPATACWLLVISGLTDVDDSPSALSCRTRSAATISRGLPSISTAKSAGPRPAATAPSRSRTVASTTTMSTPVRNRGGVWASTVATPDTATTPASTLHPPMRTLTGRALLQRRDAGAISVSQASTSASESPWSAAYESRRRRIVSRSRASSHTGVLRRDAS